MYWLSTGFLEIFGASHCDFAAEVATFALEWEVTGVLTVG